MDRMMTMHFFKAVRLGMMFAFVAGIGLSLQLSTAQAQEDGYSVMVGLPVSYKISVDENDTNNQDLSAKSPSGLRIMVNTPVNLGVGVGSYSSQFEKSDNPNVNLFWGEREIDYSFLEIMFTIPVSIVRFGIGFGLGSAEFTPAKVSAPPPFTAFYQEFKKSDAQEWFLMVGARLGDSFGVHAGFHAMTVDLVIRNYDGTEITGDFGATMGVVNGSYYF